MLIWYAPILDTYMHVVPSLLKVVTDDATKTSLSTAIVNDNMDIISDTTYDAWTYDSIHHAYVLNNSTAIMNGYNQHSTISYSSITPYKTSHDDNHHTHWYKISKCTNLYRSNNLIRIHRDCSNLYFAISLAFKM
jgi:hypothetical protein